MRLVLLFFVCCMLLFSSYCESTEQQELGAEASPFEQTIEGSMVTDFENVHCTSLS